MSEDTEGNVDLQNRRIEQEAQTDTDLETVVPPTSPMWGPTTWWRIGFAVLAVLAIVVVVSRGM